MTRITSTDPQEAIKKLAGGNPGALSVCIHLYKDGAAIDPDAAFGGLSFLLDLDTNGIYGADIWMLHKDVCKGNIVPQRPCYAAFSLACSPKPISTTQSKIAATEWTWPRYSPRSAGGCQTLSKRTHLRRLK